MGFPAELKYKIFQQRHPDYDAEYWKVCRALYAGGKRLLQDREVLKAVFPKHNGEADEVYDERIKRAFYIPYAGEIIDAIVAELTGKPLTMRADKGEDTKKSATKDNAEGLALSDDKQDAKVDGFYEDFYKNCAEPGGKAESLAQLFKNLINTGLQCGRGWTLIDLPAQPENGFANLKEQEDAGGLKAYAANLDPECVLDWEYAKNGALEFVLVGDKISKRTGIDGNRSMVTERFRYWTPDEWAVYEITYSTDPANASPKGDVLIRPNGPDAEDKVRRIKFGKHNAGRVPVIELKIPEGLWAMAKIEAIARSHFNQRCALSWAQLRALFPTPVVYLQNEVNPMSEISQTEDRATAQKHGVGYMRVMAEKDRLEWWSPDPAPFQVAAEDLDRLRDEMHRVLHHMALSVDNSGAALQRSAESKSIDQAATAVILRALGQILRDHAEDIYEVVEAVRGDVPADWRASGMEDFEDNTITQMVTDAMTLESVPIPSATFQKIRKLKLAKRVLGADCTPEVEKAIRSELDAGVTQDVYDPAITQNKLEVEAGLKAPVQPPQEKPLGKPKAKSKPKR